MKELIVEIPDLAKDHTIAIALKEDLTISDDLERECKRTPAQFGYYAVLAEKADARTKRVKLAFEQFSAETEDRIIAEAGGRSKFKAAKDLTREVAKLPRYYAFKKKIAQCEEDAGVLRQVAKAFEHKKDLVQTMNANRRKEMS